MRGIGVAGRRPLRLGVRKLDAVAQRAFLAGRVWLDREIGGAHDADGRAAHRLARDADDVRAGRAVDAQPLVDVSRRVLADVRDRRVGQAVGAEIDARVLARRRCGLHDGALQAHGGGVALLECRGVLLRRLCLSRALGVHRGGPNPGVGGSACRGGSM